MNPITHSNIASMRRFPVNTGVLLTDHSSSTTELGHVVGYALNSLDELVIEVEVVGKLHGDFEKTVERVFIHPGNKVRTIQLLSEL